MERVILEFTVIFNDISENLSSVILMNSLQGVGRFRPLRRSTIRQGRQHSFITFLHIIFLNPFMFLRKSSAFRFEE